LTDHRAAESVSQSETRSEPSVCLSRVMVEPTALAARELTSPAARRLAELAAVFDDLQFVLGCCARLLGELDRADQRDPVVVEALWAAALNAYARCFRTGEHDAGLTVGDLAATGLEGDLVSWHETLGKLRDFLVAKAANPREAFSVGVSLAAGGPAEGIVVTSIPVRRSTRPPCGRPDGSPSNSANWWTGASKTSSRWSSPRSGTCPPSG
jgi:hypothetical protein